MTTFGFTTNTGYTGVGANWIVGTKATPSSSGSLTSISLRLEGTGNIRFGIYQGTTLLGETAETAAPTPGEVITLDLITPVDIVADTEYYLCVFTSADPYLAYTNVASSAGYNNSHSYGSYPSSISWNSSNIQMEIYGTYTEAAGPANIKTLNTNAKSNIKTINTNPIANIKSLNTNV